MTLIHDDKKILGKVIDQGIGRFSGLSEIQVSCVVFYAGADTGLSNHFHIKVGSLGDSLCFQEFIFFFKILYSLVQFRKDILAGDTEFIHRNDIGACRENHRVLKLCLGFPC